MSTVNIKCEDLLNASHEYQQSILKEIQPKQQKLIDDYIKSRWFLKQPTRFQVAEWLDADSREWGVLKYQAEIVTEEYSCIQTACTLSADGVVSMDIVDAKRIFNRKI